MRDTSSSFLASDSDEDLLDLTDNFMKAKFSFLIRSLNLILLKRGDPYVAKMYKNYVRVKRKQHKKEKNFYERME